MSRPPARPAALSALRDRHRQRVELLTQVAQAETVLEEALRPPVATPPTIRGRIRRLFHTAAPPPDPAARHEGALTAWRALDFQLRSLEEAVASATADLDHARALARAAPAPPSAAPSWEAEVAAHHAATTAAQAAALTAVIAESLHQLKQQHRALRALHTAAAGAVEALALHATRQAGAACVVDEAAIAAVVRLAGECAAEVHHRVDALEERLRALDAEAAARGAARAEVEALLESRRAP